MELTWSDPAEIKLDPALVAEPQVTLRWANRQLQLPRERPRLVSWASDDRATPTVQRPFRHTYGAARRSEWHRMAAGVLITLAGTGLGVLIAGLPG